MKKTIFFLLCLLAGVCFFSCQDDKNDDIGNSIPPSTEGMLLDGGSIGSISFYCKEIDKTVIVNDYESVVLFLRLNRDTWTYWSDNKDEMNSINKIEKDYCWKKSSFILESYEEHKNNDHVWWPDLFTAYTNGEVSVTCNKTLFGEKAGTNLSSYFSINADSRCIPIGIENPKLLYNFGEEIPNNMSKFFEKGTWLQPIYAIKFAQYPSEKYDELTLQISFPMLIEHVTSYALAKYKGKELDSLYTEATYKAECPIKFNWK